MAQIESLTADAIIALINAGTWPQVFPAVVGTAAATNDQIAADVSLASSVVLGLKNVGTVSMTAGVFAFEASINSTNGIDGDWISVQAARTDSNTIENSRGASALTNGTAQLYGWEISVAGYKWFRVRCTTPVTASSLAQWTIARGAQAVEPAPAIQSHGITGTVTQRPTGGTPFSLISAASINATSVAAVAANLMEFSLFNGSAATVYLKFWDKASAPAPATDAALLRYVLAMPAGSTANPEFGGIGKRFGTGLAYALTAGVAATDVAAIGTGVVLSGTYL